MKTRVILSLVAATDANATTIRNAIDAALAGKPRFSEVRDPDAPPVFVTGTDGVRRVITSLRFESATDAAAFFTAATTEFNRARVRAGSRLSMHTCSHDNPEAEWVACNSPAAGYQERAK